ncbi:MAG: bifunctional riboflavin kinase/FAD synthetase [Proteobacteria bacterium]|nr:bifunctional riboflavin kinase/FAD synthetase [Pseudomonadota bacterium]
MMRFYRGSGEFRGKIEKSVLTLGNFDGVHLGHQQIFQRVIERSRELGASSIVYTFEPHPLKILQPERFFPLITTIEEKRGIIEKTGIDILICEDFTPEFALKAPTSFVKEILNERLRAQEIFIGPDYRFGMKREGNAELLRILGKEWDIETVILDNIKLDGIEVRSTTIRTYIQTGKITEAARLLGRFYTLEGEVIRGKGRGKQLGIPTANLKPNKELFPASGIFAVWMFLQGKRFPGVLNIGTNPTFRDQELSLEVYIMDFHDEIYGENLRIEFVEKLRDEKTFPDAGALVEQIQRDIGKAREVLGGNSSRSPGTL